MKSIKRRAFIRGIGTAVALAPGIRLHAAQTEGAHTALTKVNHKFLPTAEQVRSWHAIKDSKGGPTFAGSPSWHNYLEMLEKEWRTLGVTDIFQIRSRIRVGIRQSFRMTPTGRCRSMARRFASRTTAATLATRRTTGSRENW